LTQTHKDTNMHSLANTDMHAWMQTYTFTQTHSQILGKTIDRETHRHSITCRHTETHRQTRMQRQTNTHTHTERHHRLGPPIHRQSGDPTLHRSMAEFLFNLGYITISLYLIAILLSGVLAFNFLFTIYKTM
jgi:hypothetical protein